MGPWLGVTRRRWLSMCTLRSLCRGRASWGLRGARSAIRSDCNGKNWKLVLQILDKKMLPLRVRIKYSGETALSPARSFREEEPSYDLF